VADALDGQEGVQLYHQQPADMVITDIFMPEKDGLEVIQELTQDFQRSRSSPSLAAVRRENSISYFRPKPLVPFAPFQNLLFYRNC